LSPIASLNRIVFAGAFRGFLHESFARALCTCILAAFILCACFQVVQAKLLEAGVDYDFDANGKPSFLDKEAPPGSISWAAWHLNLDQAIVAKQYALLVEKWKTRGPAFAVIDYSVTSNGHIEAHALRPDDPTFQTKFREAQSEYHLSETQAVTFSNSNNQFEQLTLKAYRSMEGNPLLKFPDGSNRKIVRDVRWHIDAAKIPRSVRSQLDDVEKH
jgi:hypothetical protein